MLVNEEEILLADDPELDRIRPENKYAPADLEGYPLHLKKIAYLLLVWNKAVLALEESRLFLLFNNHNLSICTIHKSFK